MERGQSTVEVAIAFPVLVILLWWALVAPLVGMRALAARSAGAAGARQAALEDSPQPDHAAGSIRKLWEQLGGHAGGKKAEVSLSAGWVKLVAQETGPTAGRVKPFSLSLPQERD